MFTALSMLASSSTGFCSNKYQLANTQLFLEFSSTWIQYNKKTFSSLMFKVYLIQIQTIICTIKTKNNAKSYLRAKCSKISYLTYYKFDKTMLRVKT